jgi:hypothetical protein
MKPSFRQSSPRGPRRSFRVALLALLGASTSAAPILLCGGREVFLLDTATIQGGREEKLWRWTADDAPGLPDDLRRRFMNLDECKPVAGGRILICASSGGCALVERATGRALWHAYVINAHSLELLPRGRVIAASSLGGDSLILFDLNRPGEPLWKTPLHSAHSVVWDDGRNCLWALGFDELRRYSLHEWASPAPSLQLQETHRIPDENGHDLLTVPGSEDLLLTTKSGVFLFDRKTGSFRPHPILGATEKVKSVSIHPVTGQGVISLWSKTLTLFAPAGAITLGRDVPYKARWDAPGPVGADQ